MSSGAHVRLTVQIRSKANAGGYLEIDDMPERVECVSCFASPTALKFLNDLQPCDFKNLLFSDRLISTSDTGRELGEFVVCMEEGKYQGKDSITIHANSHGAIDSVPCGTSIVSIVNKKLETLEEEHHEYVKLSNCSLDRKTTIILRDDGLLVKRIITKGEEVTKTNKIFSIQHVKGFMSEGANLLLHRLLITKGVPDNCVFVSFDSEINICPASYEKLPSRNQIIENETIVVLGIERTLRSPADEASSWQSYFMSDGHLASRFQVGSPVIMQLSKLPKHSTHDEKTSKPKFEKTELDWSQDMQLFSMFSERKMELLGEHGTYIRDHPDLKCMLVDFVQFLLIHKPNKVLPFAADYFSSFGSND